MAEQEINFENFDIPVPWDTIPKSDVVDAGQYTLRIRELKTAGSREGKLMVVGYFTIEGGHMDGVQFPIINYVLGTDDDPICTKDPQTWKKSYGGKELNKMIDATQVVKDERSLRATLLRAQGARFNAYVSKGQQKDGEYAGTDQNRITKYAPYGQDIAVPGRGTTGGITGGALASAAPLQPRTRTRPPLPGGSNGEAPTDDIPPIPGERVEEATQPAEVA